MATRRSSRKSAKTTSTLAKIEPSITSTLPLDDAPGAPSPSDPVPPVLAAASTDVPQTPPESRPAPQARTLSVQDLVKQLRQVQPGVLGQVNDQRAAQIIRGALQQLSQTISDTDGGLLRIPALGTFNPRQVKKQGSDETVRRVLFRPPQKKPQAAES